MELAIISDIHGNLVALRSVLNDINSNGIKPEDIICSGDAALMGVQGPRCLRMLQRDEIPTGKGNTDRWVADYDKLLADGKLEAGSHTHRSFARIVGGTLIANASSVGRSYEGRAGRATYLAVHDRTVLWHVDIRQVHYDSRRAYREIQDSELPLDSKYAESLPTAAAPAV